MREIKFRIFDKQEEEFLNEEDYAINFVGTIFKACLDEEVFEVLDADMYIVTQYTGLKDKNDVEIYEGDIVYCNDVYYEVIWETAKAVVFKISKSSEIKYPKICKQYFGFNANDHVEVVGNIYKNPELLRGEG